MRRFLFLPFALIVLATGCASTEDFTQPRTDFSFKNQCEIQVSGFASVQIFEDRFEEIQQKLRDGDEASLTEVNSEIAQALVSASPTQFGAVTFQPQRLPDTFVPGSSTIEELREAVGVREVQLLAQAATRDIEAERWTQLTERYDDSLNGHCDSFFEDDIRAACEAGDGTSCFRVNRIERRDFDIIAEACELAPYMLLCEPEDPPPYDLPRINES